MKLSINTLYFYLSLLACLILPVACVDDPLIENKPVGGDMNIKEFSDGYSLSFNVTLDRLGGTAATRAETSDDYELEEVENYLDAEEFRVLFFTENDEFLFESKSRWFTETEGSAGNKAWRIGIPIFQYLSDEYGQNGDDDKGDKLDSDETYNWEAIVEYLKEHKFKVAILANRPARIKVPEINDFDTNLAEKIKNGRRKSAEELKELFGDVGPFWGPYNSILAKTDHPTDKDDPDFQKKGVMTVMDLQHCQYDPIYDAKNQNGTKGVYDDIVKWVDDPRVSPEGKEKVPYMGSTISWLGDEKRYISSTGTIYTENEYINRGTTSINARSFYRLPIDKLGKEVEGDSKHRINIPMYGIQEFDAIPNWTKGTTFNMSTQTASQEKDYHYKSISLLRSVVKLELRIPMYDNNGALVEVDLNYAQLLLNNYMCRTEPMDVSTPTNEIWKSDHSECEWIRIKKYGPFISNKVGLTDGTPNFKKRMSWFYGIWKSLGWDFNGNTEVLEYIDSKADNPYPRIFNPIVQRLQVAFISNNFLPIGIPREDFISDKWKNNPGLWKSNEAADKAFLDKELTLDKIPDDLAKAKTKYPNNTTGFYYRWVIYCGERNINDANALGSITEGSSRGFIPMFKVSVNKKIYLLPFAEYSEKTMATGTPLATLLNSSNTTSAGKENYDGYGIDTDGSRSKINGVPTPTNNYCQAVGNLEPGNDKQPYPLLRNHFYRITLKFENNGNLSFQVLNPDVRDVFINFGKK